MQQSRILSRESGVPSQSSDSEASMGLPEPLVQRVIEKSLCWRSESIRQRFPSEYEGLLEGALLACSAPGSFFWAGELAPQEGGVAILQKLPGRVWVALTPASGWAGVRFMEQGKRLLVKCLDNVPSS